MVTASRDLDPVALAEERLELLEALEMAEGEKIRAEMSVSSARRHIAHIRGRLAENREARSASLGREVTP